MELLPELRKEGTMTATDELRRMLDERGVEWSDHSDEFVLHTEWDSYSCWFNEYPDGWTAWGKCVHGTPAEAIEGTLGRETCHDANVGGKFVCSECGALVDSTDVGRSYVDEWGKRWYATSHEHGFNYCPNCGRKILEPDSNLLEPEEVEL